MYCEKWVWPKQSASNLSVLLRNAQIYSEPKWAPMFVTIFWVRNKGCTYVNFRILSVIPERSCTELRSVLYYYYELRWSSSDNTLREPDASGSFFVVCRAVHVSSRWKSEISPLLLFLSWQASGVLAGLRFRTKPDQWRGASEPAFWMIKFMWREILRKRW